MDSRMTRRRTLLLGGTLLAGALAGCSGSGDGGDGNGGDGGGGDGNGGGDGSDGGGGGSDGGGGDGGTIPQVAVGEVGSVGPLRVLVTGVERLSVAPVFGLQLRADEGNVFVAPTVTLQNASDRHVALALDGLGLHVDGTTYASDEPYVDVWSPSFGGLPMAPGELRTVPLYFEVPDGAGNGQLRIVLRTRSLPDDFGSQGALSVGLDQTAGQPASLTQSWGLEVRSPGETVSFDGLSATVAGVSFPGEVQGKAPPAGLEFAAVSLAATHGASIPNRVAIGLYAIGGMALQDDAGGVYDDRVPFTGTLDGGREFFEANGLAPGESMEGVAVVTVPAGTTPLYLTWSPPPNFWVAGTGASSNRAVWQLR